MRTNYFKWSALLLFLPFLATAQVSKDELEAFSHIKKEVPQLKQTVLSPKGQMMGQKVLLEMYFFNIGGRLSNIESSAFPINAQELMPLNLKGVKQIDLELKTPLRIAEDEIEIDEFKYNFNPQGYLESFSHTVDLVEMEQGKSESTVHFMYKDNLLAEIEKPKEKQPIFIGKDHVLLDLTTFAEDGEEISYLVYWEFDDDGNIVKRRISGDMRMSIEKKYENRYASIYDAKTQTLNGYNVYTSYSQEGSYSSKKFTNNKQIPFEVIDGYEYPDSATACFSVEQKDNTVLITQLQYGVKIKEYKFVLNDKKNIQEIVILSLEQTGPDIYDTTIDMSYKYTYTYY